MSDSTVASTAGRTVTAGGLHIRRSRLVLIGSVVAYVVVYLATLRHQIQMPGYGFLQVEFDLPPLPYLATSCMAAIAPSCWLPLRLTRPSLVFFYAQYFLLYIPAVFLVYLVQNPALPHLEALGLVAWLLAGITILQLVYSVPVVRFRMRPLTKSSFALLLAGALAIAGVYVLFVLGPGMRIAGFAEIIDVRRAAAETIRSAYLGERVTAYAMTWMQGAFLPFLMAVALFRARHSQVVLLIVAYALIYLMQGTRVALMAAFVPVLLYAWLRGRWSTDATRLVWLLAGLLLTGSALLALDSLIGHFYIDLVRLRTFDNGGILITWYYEFFKYHPNTYFSHITGIGSLVGDPYQAAGVALPFLVTEWLFDYGVMWNANAAFWAYDGIGSLGIIGVPIVSMMAASFFWLMDSILYRCDPRFAAVASSTAVLLFLNVPLPTVIASGGLGVLIAMCALSPRRPPLDVVWRQGHHVAVRPAPASLRPIRVPSP